MRTRRRCPTPPLPLAWNAELAASPARFFNRELSWLAFNRRVLEESENARHPLLERLRFLSISANNLDEFWMVRVAGLKGQVREGVRVLSQDGLTPAEQLAEVSAGASDLMRAQQRIWRDLRKKVAETAGLEIVDGRRPDGGRDRPAGARVSAVAVPGADAAGDRPGAPLPLPAQSRLLAGAEDEAAGGRQELLCPRAHAHAGAPLLGRAARARRLRPIGAKRFVLLEDLVAVFIARLFPGCDVECRGLFRVIRDSDVEIEEEAEDLVREFELLLKQRRRGSVVRVTVDGAMPGELREFIVQEPARRGAGHDPGERAPGPVAAGRADRAGPARAQVQAL